MGPDDGKLEELFDRHNKVWTLMNQLQREVGKLIITLSDIEGKINILFVLICEGEAQPKAENLLDDFQSLDKKIRVLDLLIELRGSKEEKTEWQRIYNRINQNKQMRNLVAHQGAWINDQDPNGVIKVFLGPHPVGANKKHKDVTADEIEKATNSLLHARHNLSELITMVAKRTGQWAEIPGKP